MTSRFETPGLFSRSYRTEPSLSVTARITFLALLAGSSSSHSTPASDSADFDIFAVGFCRS